MIYGKRGMKPDMKYEINMVIPPTKEGRGETTSCFSYSRVDDSERKLPTPIENASTHIRTVPLKRISERPTPAAATPERSPTVDTKLSSTPNTKFRMKTTAEDCSRVFMVFSRLLFLDQDTPN